MSELATLARPYATAAFKRSKETDTVLKWSGSLAFLSAVMKDKAISTIVNNPKVTKERLSALLLDIGQGQVDLEGENFLKLLVQNNRLDLLPQIAAQFEQFKADHEGYVDAEVTSAFAMSQEEQKKLAASLEKTLSKKVRIQVTVDQSLIGGVLVRAGDRVIDGSIKGQLQHMQKSLQ
ncbi:MAG: F0F1 ATP synthase subunit delta [Methylococcaceae bacterium]|nr:F0F1 ATP synthase subunit delta [Methylococcaceae bacterium]